MATLVETQRFASGHDDLVHDIQYDFYGKRFATCSSDHKIKIWDLDDNTGEWVLNDSWKAHDASVLKVIWAHPEFGNVLASCSFDRTVRIWEEQEHEARQSGRRWAEKARLADSKATVWDVGFAPNNLGLQLASVSAEGLVRIYEALDVVQLNQWTLSEEFEISGATRESEARLSLDWCSSRYVHPMLVVGCGKDNVAKVFRQTGYKDWRPFEILAGHVGGINDVAWAPTVGRSYHLIATACKDGHVRIFKLTGDTQGASTTSSANGSGSAATSYFAPPAPRLPSATRLVASEDQQEQLPNPRSFKFRVDCVADFDDHRLEVQNVSWNITGTMLSSTGDDGTVMMWHAPWLDSWERAAVITQGQKNGNMEVEGV